MKHMAIVIVESPFSHPTRTRDECVRYAQFAVLDCLQRGEAPFASHLFYTTVLPGDRESRGVGLACRDRIACATGGIVARYVDLGLTPGMFRAADCTATVEERRLPGDLLLRWDRGERVRGLLSLEERSAISCAAEIVRRQDDTIASLRAEIEVLRGTR